MSDCIFCKIVAGEIPSYKIYEDDDVFAFLDINPVNLGHTLVIPKEHYKDLLSTPPDIVFKLMQVVQKITPIILKSVNSNAFNLGVNVGEIAGQTVFHTHFHIMPRFEGDGRDLWKGKEVDKEKLTEISEKIKNNL